MARREADQAYNLYDHGHYTSALPFHADDEHTSLEWGQRLQISGVPNGEDCLWQRPLPLCAVQTGTRKGMKIHSRKSKNAPKFYFKLPT